MKASDRITALALIMALDRQTTPLSPELTRQLQEIGKTEPLDFNRLHNFSIQSPFSSSYMSMRIELQTEAGERGKGDKPIRSGDRDRATTQLNNSVTPQERQEPLLLEDTVREIAQSKDAVAESQKTLANLPHIGSFSGWFPWMKTG